MMSVRSGVMAGKLVPVRAAWVSPGTRRAAAKIIAAAQYGKIRFILFLLVAPHMSTDLIL
jgi:hypothetical protein